MLFALVSFAGQVQIVSDCCLYDNYITKGVEGKIIPDVMAKAGQSYDVVGFYGDYVQVKDLKAFDGSSVSGYTWAQNIIDGKIKPLGCDVVDKPCSKSKGSKSVKTAIGGQPANIVQTIITWYQVKVSDILNAWVYSGRVKEIK